MSSGAGWIAKKATGAFQPAQVESTLRTVAEKWPADAPALEEVIEQFPLGEESLLYLLSISSICSTRLVSCPEILLWLREPDVCTARRGYGRMLRDLRSLAGDSMAADDFRVLRFWKGRELFRIALREMAGAAPLEETTAELSHVAELCLTQVFEHWNAEMRSRQGSPEAEFSILGLGKLGGRELNHSSDIDVIFLYSDEGQISANFTYHQWFNRLSARIIDTFTKSHASGSLFRIDLRLRPEGASGPLARSLESMENYYAGFGETWERIALVKARSICGSRELAYEFLRQHQPFIYPKSPTPDLLDEIAAIKRRIERDIVGQENLDRNVKLGAGGIREIEFVAQALQVLHGARNTFLQETSTLKVLPALAELELLPPKEAADLDHAYRFLRWIEHRLQIEAEQQTHTIPGELEPLTQLASSLAFASVEDFLTTLHKHMQRVRTIFRRVIADRPQDVETLAPGLDFFRDQKTAAKTLNELEHGASTFHVSPRTRQVFRKLRQPLSQWLRTTANPDWALNQFVRFVEVHGLRSLLFELLVANPRLLELLMKTFDASRHASDLLIRRPQLMEEITRSGTLDRNISVQEHLTRLGTFADTPERLDAVRGYRQTETFRLLLRDILGLATLPSLVAEHSALVEACLIFVNRILGNENDLTIIALGKFGGSELGYGADLDVLFVGQSIRGAQNLTVEMARGTSEGTIAALDARLRPDGEKGPLACSIETYEAYYRDRAQLWEVQALTRTRPISGPLQAEFLSVAQTAWQETGQRDDLFAQIDAMLDRIRRDRGSGSEFLDFKTGTGGMVEAEFLVQGLQMRASIWNPTMPAALNELMRAELLPPQEAGALNISYEFLRQCESILRRWENKAVSTLPADEQKLLELVKRAGFKELDAFKKRYGEAREKIHDIYLRRFFRKEGTHAPGPL